jgi:hypothetical protein
MVYTCERCKNEVFKYLRCGYCGRLICNDCIKSSQKASKINRLIICKSCWSDMKKRGAYKGKIALITSKLA